MPDFYENPMLYSDVMDSTTDSELLIKDVDEQIRLANYKNKWLQAMCAKTKRSRSATNMTFHFMTDAIHDGTFVVDTFGTNVATWTATGAAKNNYVNELLYNANKDEVAMILSIDASNNAVTIRRSVNNPGATTEDWEKDDIVFSLGTAYGENARIPSGHVQLPGMNYNHCQRFLYSIEISHFMMKEKSHLKNPRAYWNKKLLEEHLIREEYLALFGKRGITTHNSHNAADGGKVWLTGGVYEFITTNKADLNAADLDEDLFEESIESAFNEGSDEKMLLCSPAVARRLNSWAKENIRYSPGDNKIGLACRQYISPSGLLDICPTKILKNINLSGSFDGDIMFIIDPSQVSRVINKPTKFMPDMQSKAEGISVIVDVFEGCYGWDPGMEQTHAVIQNFK